MQKNNYVSQDFIIGERRVTIEVDLETGNVLVFGAARVISHFLAQRKEGELRFVGQRDDANSHVSFHCEVTDDGKSVSAELLTGPSPAWQRNLNPVMKVASGSPAAVGDEVTLVVSAHADQGLAEGFLLRKAAWKK